MNTLVVVLIVTLFLFFIFREVFCWYWKINERVAMQKEMLDLLRTMAERTASSQQATSADNGKESATSANTHP